MNRIVIKFLLWLLIAALPLQGVAASLRPCCLPAQGQAGAMTMSMHMEMPMAQPQGEPHCHEMAGAAAGHHQPAQEKSALHDHDCNNHLACGAGACGPPFGAAVILPAVGPTMPALAVAQLFSDHIPSGLERPPRPASL